jgi:hypothetical protein
MRPRYWSSFWIGYLSGLVCLSEAWAARDCGQYTDGKALDCDQYTGSILAQYGEPIGPPIDPEKEMQAWLRLTEAERAAVVETYSVGRRPLITYITSKERRAVLAAD